MAYRLIASVVFAFVVTGCRPQTPDLSGEQRTQCLAQGGAIRNDEAGNIICTPRSTG